jgi:hypothetical protein
VGRPRVDRLALVERVADVLSDEPGASANTIQRRVRGRRRGAVAAAKAREARTVVLKLAEGDS